MPGKKVIYIDGKEIRLINPSSLSHSGEQSESSEAQKEHKGTFIPSGSLEIDKFPDLKRFFEERDKKFNNPAFPH